ncbi:Ionotropic glutamate receptor [Macleaya cordata]|uniref:Ionotropic glutamate receptor n=1 Tax=Macleaya cordata TaxID=56857 RepID=A0A200Q192_MACCD|nr:Ionotropic glutamate receptor [Macleaya cordata]
MVFIHEDTNYGNGLIPYLISAFQEVDAQVPYRSVISPLATDTEILEELDKLMNMQTRVFIVHMNPSLGSRLFFMAKALGMMSERYAWIITDSMTNLLNSLDSFVIESMQGVLGVSPYVPKSKELDTFRVSWKKNFLQENSDVERIEPSIHDLWAYDMVWALAMAAEEVGSMNSSFQNPKFIDNSSDLAMLGVSRIGPRLLQTIRKTEFRGLSGIFRLIDGLLQLSIFQILNVIGNGGREVGFWTPQNGILRQLSRINSSVHSTSMSNLRGIIWPGESINVPKGWGIPTNRRPLSVCVPLKSAFTEFVKVDLKHKTRMVTGLRAPRLIQGALWRKRPLKKYPPGGLEGIRSGDLWGANPRSNHSSNPSRTFTHGDGFQLDSPLLNVWLITLKPLRERVRSNLSRMVLIIWVFVVLILTSSYTASLTSTLTVQQLTVSDINQLIRNGDYVGHQQGSYVQGLLKRLHFDESKLRGYVSPHDYADALSKGSQKGGVAAIFDEILYIKVFLSKYCDKYAMVGPTYNTNGFGFVFRKGSPLVLDVSKAISDIEGDDQLTEIDMKWFRNKTSCQDPGSTVSLSSLTIDSFRGLFLITSITSTFALFIFFGSFPNENMHILTNSAGSEDNSNMTQRLVNLAIRFYQSEELCRTLTRIDQERQVMDPLIPSEHTTHVNTHNIQEDGTTSTLDELRQFN